MEEIKLPQKWDEVKHMLLESIIPEDHEAVLGKWDTMMILEAEADSAFSVEYHTKPAIEGRKPALWRMNILMIENRQKKQALIMCRDSSIDMKNQFLYLIHLLLLQQLKKYIFSAEH